MSYVINELQFMKVKTLIMHAQYTINQKVKDVTLLNKKLKN